VFSDELQDVIDSLLAQACPDWTPPQRVPPTPAVAERRRQRLEVTRARLGRALSGQPDLTARLSATIFKAILLEHSLTDQLTAPLIAALGRRAALEQLIDAVSEGACQRRGNAAMAAYWVRCWRHPQESAVLRSAFAHGARSAAEFRGELASHLPPRPAGADNVDDLWPRFWQACLTTFIECDDAEVRRRLQTAFPNEARCYPPEFAGLLEQARAIAEADPGRFQRLANRSTGYGYRI
jgi:hypothetical protein